MDRPLNNNKPHCLPLTTTCGPSNFNPFTLLALCLSKSCSKPQFPDGSLVRRPALKERAVSCRCAEFREMESKDDEKVGEAKLFGDTVEDECRESSSSCEASFSEERGSCDDTEESSSKETEELDLPMRKSSVNKKDYVEDEKIDKCRSKVSDIEMMKDRFSKLLLGEDMSGCGKGVCTALAISNAITNLCATLFGQLWRLEPLPPEKKSMWQREMDWLLCVSDHIVEMTPSWQTFPDGRKLEVMTCRPRSDLFINLPALRKLDNMLLEILDGFRDQEFWYVDKGISAADSDGSASFRRPLQRQEEKWWLPVPHVPPGGLSESSRKQLHHKRECTNQILKAAMVINANALAEMEVPESYLDSLPKNGKESLGVVMHRYITSDQFSAECLLDCLEFSSEHQALEIANRLEASIYMWRQKTETRPKGNAPRSSWGKVREKMIDAEKREAFADRAESLLICLKQRFPGLTQTTLDMSKIQFNKDVGKSILESYSRVLESLAFNIVARIDDLLYVDDLSKHSDHFSTVAPISAICRKSVSIPYPVPVSSTPYATTYDNASFSPSSLISPAMTEKTPVFSRKAPSRGFSVRKVLTDYLTREVKGKNNNVDIVEVSAPVLVTSHEALSP